MAFSLYSVHIPIFTVEKHLKSEVFFPRKANIFLCKTIASGNDTICFRKSARIKKNYSSFFLSFKCYTIYFWEQKSLSISIMKIYFLPHLSNSSLKLKSELALVIKRTDLNFFYRFINILKKNIYLEDHFMVFLKLLLS